MFDRTVLALRLLVLLIPWGPLRAQTISNVGTIPPGITRWNDNVLNASFDLAGFTGTVDVTFTRDDGATDSRLGVPNGPNNAIPLFLGDLTPRDGRPTSFSAFARSSSGQIAFLGSAINFAFDSVPPAPPVASDPPFPADVFSDVLTIRGTVSSVSGATQTTGSVFVVSQSAPNPGEVVGAGAILPDGTFVATVDVIRFALDTPVNLQLFAEEPVQPTPNRSQAITIQITRRQADPPAFTGLTCQPASGSLTRTPAVIVRGQITGANDQRFKVYFFVDGALVSEIGDLGNGARFAHSVNLPSDGSHLIRVQGVLEGMPPDFLQSVPVCSQFLDTIPARPPVIIVPSSIGSTLRTSMSDFELRGFSVERSFTATGPDPRIELVGPFGIVFIPASPLTPNQSTSIFTTRVGIEELPDGQYTINVSSVDAAGNTSAGSSVDVLFIKDTTPPTVDRVRVNTFIAPQNNPEIYVGRELVTIELRTTEDMVRSPRLTVTQSGGGEVTAGLSVVDGRVFSYNFVPVSGQEGPVNIRTDRGTDLAGNVIEFELDRLFVVDTTPPQVVSVDPTDSTTTNRTPSRIRVVFRDPPSVAETFSGMDLAASEIFLVGPLGADSQEILGTLVPFDPVTLDFIPAADLTADGTYEIQIFGVDRVGNRAEVSRSRFRVDTTPIQLREGLVFCTPPDRATVGPTTMPGGAGAPFVQAFINDLQFDPNASKIDVSDFCRVPPIVPGTKTVINANTIQYAFRDPLATDGSQDGTYLTRIIIVDSAGNTSPETFCTFVYDSLPPLVTDTFPRDGDFINGPLRIVDATVEDPLPDNCRTRSGIDRGTTAIQLSLVTPNPFTNTKTPSRLDGVLRFVSLGTFERVLLEITDASNVPVGLATNGTDDGVYRIDAQAFDESGNRSGVTSAVFTYDTLLPEIDVNVLADGQTITGPQMLLTGTARDNIGGSGLDRVTASLFMVDSQGLPTTSTPVLLNTTGILIDPPAGAPPRSRGFRVVGDLFNVSTAFRGRLIVSAIDRSSNRRDREFIVNVQPTPIGPPVLSVPRNRSATSSQILDFGWTGILGAQDYELKIITPKRNEIRRRTGGAPGLRVNLALQTDGDGDYFWSAAAVDGGMNVQTFAQNFVVTVDTHPPRVLAIDLVDPSPEANGVINAGEVRFKITFNETMDVTHPLNVRIDPESSLAAEIPVEPLSFDENIWIGRAVIPTTQEGTANLNGLATLIVADGQDRAGNLMIPPPGPLTVFEIDTGPALSIGFFQNPVDRRDLILVVKAFTRSGGVPERLIEPPTVTFRRPGETNQSPQFKRLNESAFQGTFRLNTGNASNIDLTVTARDDQGNTVNRNFTLNITQVDSTPGRIVVSQSSALSLKPPPSLPGETKTIVSVPCRLAEPVGTKGDQEGELRSLVPLDQFGPQGLTLPGGANLEVDLDRLGLPDSDRLSASIGLYWKQEESWIRAPQTREGSIITARLDHLAPVALMKDLRAPVVTVAGLDDQNRIDTDLMEVEIQITDPGAGPDPQSLSVSLGGRVLEPRFLNGGSVHPLAATPIPVTYIIDGSEFPSGERHALKIQIADHAGNITRSEHQVIGPLPPGISQFVPVPNPARILSTLRYTLNRSAQRASIRIYDSSGRRVTRLEGTGSAGINEVVWDLTDEHGRPVGAGVYLARLEVQHDSGRLSERTKIAVMR